MRKVKGHEVISGGVTQWRSVIGRGRGGVASAVADGAHH